MNFFVQKLYNLAYRLSGDTGLARELCLDAAVELGREGFSRETSDLHFRAARTVVGLVLYDRCYHNRSPYPAADDPSPRLQAALSSLPVEERVAVVLRDFCGLSYGEVGLILGRDKREVSRLLSEGRFGMRRWLMERKES